MKLALTISASCAALRLFPNQRDGRVDGTGSSLASTASKPQLARRVLHVHHQLRPSISVIALSLIRIKVSGSFLDLREAVRGKVRQ